VYYHCTENKGKCPEKYVREEEIAAQFGEALRAIQLDGDVFTWIVTALKASHHDIKQYHDERVTALQKQYQKLQDRLDRMYIDKLDGSVSQDQFERMSEAFRKEQYALLRQIEKHQHANQTYLDEGVHLLELAQKAVMLYEKQDMVEKRRLLNFVCSNSQWKDGKLIPAYRKPFDLLAVTNTSYQKTKAASNGGSSFCPVWLPEPHHRENFPGGIRVSTRTQANAAYATKMLPQPCDSGAGMAEQVKTRPRYPRCVGSNTPCFSGSRHSSHAAASFNASSSSADCRAG
jgi:hypothetical protein